VGGCSLSAVDLASRAQGCEHLLTCKYVVSLPFFLELQGRSHDIPAVQAL
jgi:hypothetical protein